MKEDTSRADESTEQKKQSGGFDASDVAAAVLRQKTFIDSMARIGWLEDGWPRDPTSLIDLQRGIVRYRTSPHLFTPVGPLETGLMRGKTRTWT